MSESKAKEVKYGTRENPKCAACGWCCLLDITVIQHDGTTFKNPAPHACVHLKLNFDDKGLFLDGKCGIFNKPERAEECKKWYCYGNPRVRKVTIKGRLKEDKGGLITKP